MHPVIQDEEGQSEDGEGVLDSQFAVLHVDVKLFGEAVDRQHRELPGSWVDVGEVVAGLVQVAAAGQDQATAGTVGPRAAADGVQAAACGVLVDRRQRLRELGLVEAGVGAAGGQQLAVRALLDDLPVLHHQDEVGVADGRQPVRDDEAGPALPQ